MAENASITDRCAACGGAGYLGVFSATHGQRCVSCDGTGEYPAAVGVLIQQITRLGCQDCVSVERTFDPAKGWIWVVHDCALDQPLQGFALAELVPPFRQARRADVGDAR